MTTTYTIDCGECGKFAAETTCPVTGTSGAFVLCQACHQDEMQRREQMCREREYSESLNQEAL